MAATETLTGGHLTPVVRIGNTVRREASPWTATTQALLRHLEREGFGGAPRALGIDKEGREILSFIKGRVASGGAPAYVWRHEVLVTLASLMRRFHDATLTFVPPADAQWQWQAAADPPGPENVICHNDIAPWNTVFVDEGPVAFIDWDIAAPGPRLWDIAYTLWVYVPLSDDAKCESMGVASDLEVRAQRIKLFCDAYGLTSTDGVLAAVRRRQTSTYETIRHHAEQGETAYMKLWDGGAREGIAREREWVQDHAAELEAYLVSHS